MGRIRPLMAPAKMSNFCGAELMATKTTVHTAMKIMVRILRVRVEVPWEVTKDTEV